MADAEFEKWQTWVGRQVRIRLTNGEDEDPEIVEGELVKLTDDGEATYRLAGQLWYCWPALDIELVEGVET